MKPPSALLFAMEGRAMFEWASYGLAWPWLKKAPRGDGHPVLVLPGLVAGDRSTYPLRRFLTHLGYETYPWQQGLNVGPRDVRVGFVRPGLAMVEKSAARRWSSSFGVAGPGCG